jgi:hypothetical protein
MTGGAGTVLLSWTDVVAGCASSSRVFMGEVAPDPERLRLGDCVRSRCYWARLGAGTVLLSWSYVVAVGFLLSSLHGGGCARF